MRLPESLVERLVHHAPRPDVAQRLRLRRRAPPPRSRASGRGFRVGTSQVTSSEVKKTRPTSRRGGKATPHVTSRLRSLGGSLRVRHCPAGALRAPPTASSARANRPSGELSPPTVLRPGRRSLHDLHRRSLMSRFIQLHMLVPFPAPSPESARLAREPLARCAGARGAPGRGLGGRASRTGHARRRGDRALAARRCGPLAPARRRGDRRRCAAPRPRARGARRQMGLLAARGAVDGARVCPYRCYSAWKIDPLVGEIGVQI